MRVLIPSPLRSYTAGSPSVRCFGSTLAELTQDMDRSYPGLRFRIIDEQGQIRQHIRFFVNGTQCSGLSTALNDADEVMIVCALSGG